MQIADVNVAKPRNSNNKNTWQIVFSFSIFPDVIDSLKISYVRTLNFAVKRSLILKHGNYSQKKTDHLTQEHM